MRQSDKYKVVPRKDAPFRIDFWWALFDFLQGWYKWRSEAVFYKNAWDKSILIFITIIIAHDDTVWGKRIINVSVKFSSVIYLTVDNYYLRDFGFISISV